MRRLGSRGQPPGGTSSDGFAGLVALRGRVVVSALSGVLLVVAVAAFLAWRQYDDTARHGADARSRARANLAGTLLDTYFAGQIAALQAMAAAPAVVNRDEAAMSAYFKRVQPPNGPAFTGGIGWIDHDRRLARVEHSRPPSVPEGERGRPRRTSRPWSTTEKPYISEGMTTRRTGEHAIVMAVPTHDAAGKLSGVLAGVLLVGPTPTRSNGDRPRVRRARGVRPHGAVGAGRLHASRATRRCWTALRADPDGGVIGSTDGLDGESDHVVALRHVEGAGVDGGDRPARSTVLAAARRSLVARPRTDRRRRRDGPAAVVRTVRRARREAERRDALGAQQRELAGALASASAVRRSRGRSRPRSRRRSPARSPSSRSRPTTGSACASPPRPAGRSTAPSHGRAVTEALEAAYGADAPVALPTEAQLRARRAAVAEAFAGAVRSAYATALVAPDGDRVGALALLFADERTLDDAEEALVAAQAEQAAIAIQRTRERERDHERDRPPAAEPAARAPAGDGRASTSRRGTTPAARASRSAATGTTSCSGDDGLVHLTVGDVAGRGIGAAALMGQLRNAFRAYALDHASPGEIVQRLLRHVGDDDMATAVDRHARSVLGRACGTRRPGIRRRSCSTSARAPSRCSTPRPARRSARPAAAVAEGQAHCAPGSTILLYTDGLIEHRGATIDDGITQVVDGPRGERALAAGALADAVLERAAAGVELADDIAMLVVRYTACLPRRRPSSRPSRARRQSSAPATSGRRDRARLGVRLVSRAVAQRVSRPARDRAEARHQRRHEQRPDDEGVDQHAGREGDGKLAQGDDRCQRQQREAAGQHERLPA